MSRTVHVIQGLSAAGSLKQAIHPGPGELLANEDVLSCGPLPHFQSLDEWARVRKAYWDSVAFAEEEGPFNRDLLANQQMLREVDSIVLWVGTGAAEQLLLAWMWQFLKLIETRAEIQVIQFSPASHGEYACGLGLLNPEQLKRHPPAEPLSTQATLELERLWKRVTSSDPMGLLSVLSEEPGLLPLSRAALQPLVYRYPDHRTGLGRWESELLRKAQEKGPRVVRVIGHTMGDNFGADLVGDLYLFSRLRCLADSSLTHPLVAISGDHNSMRDCQVTLTDVGSSVLAGHTNALEINGIDDWILGVHLDSKRGSVWCQKDGTLVAR